MKLASFGDLGPAGAATPAGRVASRLGEGRRRRGAGAPRYSPYAVDWRFLPEPALVAKDFVRHYFIEATDALTRSPALAPVWVRTLGRRTLKSVASAKMLFIHIPKTGGTSISQVLYGRNLPHYTAEFYVRLFGASVSRWPSFAVIRDPIARALSIYKMAVDKGTDIIAHDRFRLSQYRGLDTFDSFVEFLYENRSRLHKFSMELRPQIDFVSDADGVVLVDRLFAFEPARGLPDELSRWLGVDTLPHLNATGRSSIRVSEAADRMLCEIYERDLRLYERVVSAGLAFEARGEVIRAAA